jgi:hypothetical protein
VGKPISVFDSVKIAKAILELNLLPAKLDIGKLLMNMVWKRINIQMPNILLLTN